MISIENATFRYLGSTTPSISSLSLRVAEGECVLLCGPSGSGKTTVARLIGGLIPRFFEGELAGSVKIGGRDVTCMGTEELTATVGSVFQDPRSQFFTTDTTSEMAFTCENMGMPRDEMLDRIALSSCALGVSELLERSIFSLSSGEKQRIAIGSVHAYSPPILVFDEPSANLDPAATRQLAQVLATLKREGRTIVIVEHRLEYLAGIVDRAVVMSGGKKEAELERDEFLALDVAGRERYSLRQTAPGRIAEHVRAPTRHAAANPLHLDVSSLSFAYKRGHEVLRDMSLEAQSGEVIALVGANGAGKTTLASVLSGLRRPSKGVICLNGRRMSARALRKASYFVMQDVDYQLFGESVAAELLLGVEGEPGAEVRAAEVCERLGLSGLESRHPASLSGGQKQRVTIGAALMKRSGIIILDEPTSGLDALNLRRVAGLICALADDGRIVFVITHDRELVMRCCTRAIHLADGRLQSDLNVQAEKEAIAALF